MAGLNTAKSLPERGRQRRNSMLGKIHVARKQMALADDDYRQIVLDETGHMSAGDCSDSELVKILERLKRLGFKPKTSGKAGADHPVARKARALWISLYHLGAIRNASDHALEAFAKRQLNVERLQWANQSQGYRLIEALKAMAEREGWQQGPSSRNASASVHLLQLNLCRAILAKLVDRGLAAPEWDMKTAAFRLCGTEIDARTAGVSVEEYSALAKALGDKLREATQ